MATKPSTTPTWATDAGTTLEPSAGQKAAGFTLGTRPPARWFNWFFNLVSQWLAYLRDGAFTGGVSVAGGLTADTLHTTGAATVDGALFADSMSTTGGATIGDALDVGSDATVGGAVSAASVSTTGAVAAGGAVTGTSVTATGKVSGTGVGSEPAVSATAGATGPAVQLAPGSSTVSAERCGTQATPTGAGLVGDRWTDAAGRVRTCRAAGTPGTFRAIGAPGSRQIFTTGSGTYTTPPGVTAIRVRLWGGGGGGGGAQACAVGQSSCGSGGGQGGYAEAWIFGPAASYPYSIGAGGAGGTVASPLGSDGLPTTFSTYKADAGGGGDYLLAGASVLSGPRGGECGATGVGDFVVLGEPGGRCFRLTATTAIPGDGGGSGGGTSAGGGLTGGAGAVPGGGGGGASEIASGDGASGGAGGKGLIVVEEYY